MSQQVVDRMRVVRLAKLSIAGGGIDGASRWQHLGGNAAACPTAFGRWSPAARPFTRGHFASVLDALRDTRSGDSFDGRDFTTCMRETRRTEAAS
jgi:hypothetical protein